MTDNQFIQASQSGDVTIIHLAAMVNERALVIEFTEQLLSYVDEQKPTKLQLNFENVRFFSSEAINALIRANKRIKERNGRMNLCGLNADLRHMFKICGLDGTILEIHDLCSDATASLTD